VCLAVGRKNRMSRQKDDIMTQKMKKEKKTMYSQKHKLMRKKDGRDGPFPIPLKREKN